MSDVRNTAAHDVAHDAVYAAIDALVDHARLRLELDARDADWTRNRIFARFGLSSYRPTGATANGRDVDELLAALRDALLAAGLIDVDDWADTADAIMGALCAAPSAIQRRFAAIERSGNTVTDDDEPADAAPRGGMDAMRWFYDYCANGDYVKRAALGRNPRFDSHGLTVTINLAKPEFKNMKKAAAGNAVAGGYPACTICHENEGFAGRAKRTLRTIPVTLGGEPWFWQFSPYGYFDQHGICVNMRHTPMHVDRDTFGHLLDFVDRFPGYFLGCNAALPRIGGSVLAHDHYQGGGEILPMFKAATWATLTPPNRTDATVEILDWPGTAIRVVSRSRGAIVDVADMIREAWVDYDDAQAGIASHDADGNRQSALSPSVIKTVRGYEMSLIFRNNAVSDEYPEGIFHAHPKFWPVKQEPIGLIEAQGLFILPGRLVGQLGLIEDALAEGRPLPDEVSEFTLVWNELTEALDGSRDRDVIRAAVRDELGSICERILGNTAVFKCKEQALTFLEEIGFARHAH
ncbi:galactose-1-phosphate uridylyltransferase [Bifidobacterium biavatii]|uniref:Galactose-1-phosphate uridylyltransferase n=1 Tax=Bifidobacterium biavatii DSM 23969 TaxID=1437608 RepID=A0A086ZSG7_9BIFI|nr:galactose-1-phosphate uridylyltransferase [Bifidobacterium biavatii]KFI49467.1 putative UTP--hexose-1-phosphate uridylyltransferase [Bifidobacterium biavatii DSM 23969]